MNLESDDPLNGIYENHGDGRVGGYAPVMA